MLNLGKDNTSGFTIVELLVSLLVGSLLVGGVALLTNSYTHLSQRSLYVTLSNSFAENKIESVRSLGFSGLAVGTTDVTSELPGELKNPRSATLQISTTSTDIKKVDLSITYNEQGAPRTYNYSTYVGELGVGQY